ncbi:MAG: YncE family protein, partial [Muribaculaceae bacterium]|nr:YncE family protein [Muribaculaceae bacterium]
VRFHRGKAYVSSYVGPVQVGVDTPKGAIYEVDTLSLAVTAKVTVGYQPEEMEIVGDYMYVANSGGYRAPQYDNTVSVIQMSDFKQVQQIPVDINLHRVKKDRYDKLWINSRGDNQSRPSCLYVLSRKLGESRLSMERKLDIRCSNMAIKGDSLYYFATGWNASAAENEVSYGIIDVRSQEVVSESFITDGTDREITVPYGIAVHPENGDIFVTDAKNYVSSGTLYCFDRHGRKKWSVRTGDIPSQICFLPK